MNLFEKPSDEQGVHVRFVTTNRGKRSYYGVYPNSQWGKSGTPIKTFKTRMEADTFAASHVVAGHEGKGEENK